MTRFRELDPSTGTGDHSQSPKYTELERALSNERYIAYADGKGPLMISELTPEIATSDEFMEIVSQLGWPNLREDSSIEPPSMFESVEDFRATLTNRSEDNLGNFKAWLRVKPGYELAGPTTNMSDFIHSKNPALHRAWCVAPDLFEALNKAFNELPNFAGYASDEVLQSEEATPVVIGAMMAYRILGRLLKADDMATQARLVHEGFSGEMPAITNADEILRQ